MEYDEKNGGPAFPISLPGHGDNGHGGMTLRDWFAGQALIALHASGNHTDPDNTADRAFRLADAMLATRATTD